MAVNLSARARILSQKRNIEPNLILEIDGISTVFSSIITLKAAKYGEDDIYYGMPGLVYGGSVAIEDQKNYITLDGSGPTITQQLLQDKGGTQSVASLNIELIDTNNEISQIISPGVILDDIIGVKARVYLNFKNGRHPDDSVLIHRGIIDQVETAPASIKLNISQPEAQKRQELFIKRSVQLDGAIDAVVTTIPITQSEGFILPTSPTLLTYIKVDDEIIKYTGISGNSFTGCVRGSLGSTAASHADDSDVESFYRLQGNAMDLALQLMMSNGDEYFATDIPMVHIGALGPTDIRLSYILFPLFNVQEQYGLVKGDFLRIVDSDFNDGVDILITGFGQIGGQSYIITSTTFVEELSTPGTVSFKSKYNILTEGMGMTPQDVDVERHELYNTRFTSQMPDYDFYIKDTITGKDFLSTEIYYPAGLYSIPRKSRASVGITLPPLSDQTVPTLDENTVINPASLKTTRTTSRNFYNAIVYKYNQAALDDKFANAKVAFSTDSQNRIKNVGNKPLTIESSGLRNTPDSAVIIRNISRRLLDRYKFAAESLQGVKVLYKTGFNIDVGDIVVFGSPSLKVTDSDSGTRATPPKLYEVVNKSLSIKTGEVKLDLLSTAFNIDGRYGVISPATQLDSGSTTTVLKIKDSFSTTFPDKEKDKWSQYIGETILVHSTDYSFAEETTLVGFSLSDDYKMNVNPALSAPPPADYIIDVPNYPNNTDAHDNEKYKLIHCFFTPQVAVVTGISQTQLTVGGGDVGKFFVGSILRVHDITFSNDSPESIVTAIVGTTITVDTALGFTPDNTYLIDLIGFTDLGKPYRYI